MKCDICISIIVPVYTSNEKHLRKCIESLTGQTYINVQIILIDDGSPDNCGIICDEYAKYDNRIRVIHQENKGVSEARNKGIEVAGGEYLMFVDADDWLEEKCCERVLGEALDKGYEVTYFHSRRFFENESCYWQTSIDKSWSFSELDINRIKKDTICWAGRNYPFNLNSPWGRLIKKDFFINASLRFIPRIKTGQDMILNLYMLDNLKCAGYLNYTGYNYRVHEASITGRFHRDAVELELALFEEIEKFVNEKCGEIKSYTRALGQCCIRMTNMVSNMIFSNANCLISFNEKKKIYMRWMDNPLVRRNMMSCSARDFDRPWLRLCCFLLQHKLITIYLWARRLKGFAFAHSNYLRKAILRY